METLDQQQPERPVQPETKSIELQKETLNFLNETRKWGYFLAIMGFIVIGLMVLAGLFMGLVFSTFKPAAMGNMPFPPYIFAPVYILIGLVYLFPTLYLLRFSTWTKKGLEAMSTENIHQAFRNLKSLFRFIGIFTIVMIGLYVLIILGAMVFGAMKAFI
ncbi:MAG TPA: DUF5362 family protein [Sunxiuqinia sp.]|nr:DUF5362 family protein [Sunxiuqinia sp.]